MGSGFEALELLKEMEREGLVPSQITVEKEFALSYHSEKIAVAFILINTGAGVPIRVVKNLRRLSPGDEAHIEHLWKGDHHTGSKLVSPFQWRQVFLQGLLVVGNMCSFSRNKRILIMHN
ncbi:hypothetical protein MLD38_037035 [Melastoma candidum]|uniref:Uncharacterized protein n=2 Tax=Melastoma candidum TaxID=119954 RepID=A0ACB9LLE6_9MYRT|nr:hypothetical protein MLD38_037032 [Melastoma candidum]KAI4312196.1 hypothetical protein MLD38_037035 [Melastoma candidum]